MTEPSRDDMKALIAKLENGYDFQCEGGPLKNCVDWHVVRDAAARLSEVEATCDLALQASSNRYGEYITVLARAEAAEARLSEVEKALEEAGNFLKGWDSGSSQTEHGWFYDEFLEQWLKIQAALHPKGQ